MTQQQARDYNMLLEIKERVESKYKDKNRINIINKKPRIIFMSNIEENKISDEAKQRAKNYMSLKGALEPKQETLEDELWGNVFAKIKQYGLNNEVLTILKQKFNISKR